MKKLKVLKPSKPVARIGEAALRQWIVDFHAADCIPLRVGVCLAVGLNPSHPSNARGIAKDGTLGRTLRVASLRYCSASAPGRVADADATMAGSDDIVVRPRELFSWLRTYLLKVPGPIGDWLDDEESAIRACHEFARTEYDDEGIPFLDEPLPLSVRSSKSDEGKQAHRKLQTALKVLGVLVLAEHSEKLKKEKPDWTFLPKNRQGKEKPIPGKDPEKICSGETMKSYIVRSLVVALSDEPRVRRDFPGLAELLDADGKVIKGV
ncbi:hypothetical protein J7U46_08885 [Pelomonas sp. V22]|uniref:hypothetical protein n=1 Tax=Pelomonas sp. V22 TaxID=2822139 RepID=UPI0024A846E3|nr:hypothetical protein [Pelomonas sp. V22]MDI4633159.1 hypothetical protein [Pelomonas sp. V22]